MNIVVCYKIVPDEQDAVVQADRTLSFERSALKIGDYDLNAVEAGAQLASASGASLVSLTAGGDPVEDSKLKKAILARGPHENVAVKDASLPEAGNGAVRMLQRAALEVGADLRFGDVLVAFVGIAHQHVHAVDGQPLVDHHVAHRVRHAHNRFHAPLLTAFVARSYMLLQ